jgi:hypothetical protein
MLITFGPFTNTYFSANYAGYYYDYYTISGNNSSITTEIFIGTNTLNQAINVYSYGGISLEKSLNYIKK